MTIIQPHQNVHKGNFLILLLMCGAIALAVWGLFLYNQLVNLRYEVKRQKTSISQAEVANAELKNNLYSVIDSANLQASANTQSLVLDKNPEYVKNQQLAQQ